MTSNQRQYRTALAVAKTIRIPNELLGGGKASAPPGDATVVNRAGEGDIKEFTQAVFRGAPVLGNESRIERRAQAIPDPIERLRYLRRVTSARPEGRSRAHSRFTPLLLACLVLPLSSDALVRSAPALLPPAAANSVAAVEISSVWPVEQNRDYDLYSNGLRIENDLAVANEPRAYRLISSQSPLADEPLRSQPAGIVFHTTESDQLPFEEEQRPRLKRIGRELLLYVRQKRAYHFLIDRFGRVHRIVVESDAANHAGHSLWADSRWLYPGLNASFLGVAFEAQTQTELEPINTAQIHAGRILTEMLRSKYNLPAENCVTHAQVSVNPANMRIGWHTDWGSRFPFRELGLPNNYEQPNPSVYQFGFDYDSTYLQSAGLDLRKGLELADERVRTAATAQRVTVAAYKRFLRQRYRGLTSGMPEFGRTEEN
ncbi:MAG: hypothetical protein C5B51_30725 [Terriglobia bacterium]|nr:MAG: hypothetical protein C5B51_30725 [Terriglobia bacterium]